MPQLTTLLASDGPIVEVHVGVSMPRVAALRGAGQPVPNAIKIRALLDTGASCTAIDKRVIQQLNLTPTGTVPVHTPSTGAGGHTCNQYDVAIAMVNPQSWHIMSWTLPIIETDLSAQNIMGLIGRDLLVGCLLVYNGYEGFISLTYG